MIYRALTGTTAPHRPVVVPGDDCPNRIAFFEQRKAAREAALRPASSVPSNPPTRNEPVGSHIAVLDSSLFLPVKAKRRSPAVRAAKVVAK